MNELWLDHRARARACARGRETEPEDYFPDLHLWLALWLRRGWRRLTRRA